MNENVSVDLDLVSRFLERGVNYAVIFRRVDGACGVDDATADLDGFEGAHEERDLRLGAVGGALGGPSRRRVLMDKMALGAARRIDEDAVEVIRLVPRRGVAGSDFEGNVRAEVLVEHAGQAGAARTVGLVADELAGSDDDLTDGAGFSARSGAEIADLVERLDVERVDSEKRGEIEKIAARHTALIALDGGELEAFEFFNFGLRRRDETDTGRQTVFLERSEIFPGRNFFRLVIFLFGVTFSGIIIIVKIFIFIIIFIAEFHITFAFGCSSARRCSHQCGLTQSALHELDFSFKHLLDVDFRVLVEERHFGGFGGE